MAPTAWGGRRPGVPGVAMRAVGSSTKAGATIIGIALEDFDGTYYLSPATIEELAVSVATGTPVCTQTVVTRDTTVGGGASINGGNADTTGVTYEETCTQPRVTVRLEAGTALSMTTRTTSMNVKVGKLLMFIGIERNPLQFTAGSASSGIAWQNDGTPLDTLLNDLDLGNHAILNVSRITSASGNWYIDDAGNIRAESVATKRLIVEDSAEVGSSANPTGITVYDTVNGLPYCMQVAAGLVASLPGACVSADASGGGGEAPPANSDTPTPTPTTPPDAPPAPPSAPESTPPVEPDSTPEPAPSPAPSPAPEPPPEDSADSPTP